MRGATKAIKESDAYMFISIHAPHAGSDTLGLFILARWCGFQSTLPMRGATVRRRCGNHQALRFQSTLPMRGATGISLYIYIYMVISIHAPHAGSDLFGLMPKAAAI